MFTVCPKCSLRLGVTAGDLRVAQGYVRCGRCSNVFNALAGLSDEQQAALTASQHPAPAAAAPPPPPPPPPSPPPAAAPAPAASAAPAAAAQARPAAAAPAPRARPPPAPAPVEEPGDLSLEFDPTRTDVTAVFVEHVPAADPQGSGTFESIVLASPDDTLEEDTEQEDISADEMTEFELKELAAAVELARPTRVEPPPSAPSPTRTDSPPSSPAPVRTAAPAPAVADLPDDAETGEVPLLAGAREPDSVPVRRALITASVIAALVLVLQVVHHYRSQLAEIEALRGPLTNVYASLGLPLVPNWDVSAYEVRQLGAMAGPQSPGRLTVRASVKNRAPRSQPLPLLRVTMQDVYGNRVASRDVPPGAYSIGANAVRSYLAAGQRVDAEVAFVDPGPGAVGFEIDACLADGTGRITCANDAARAR